MLYFMQFPDGGNIKIGTSKYLPQRHRDLCRETGEHLHVLAVLDGDLKEEKALHRRFSHLHVDGELFRPEKDLLDFIKAEGRPWDEKGETPRPVRLGLSPGSHRLLRLIAADAETSMSAYVQTSFVQMLREEADRKGIRA